MGKRVETTPAEDKAIRALQRIAKTWPASLWLFSAAGTLTVMKYDEDGERYRLDHGGMDPQSAVARIDIPNDGGDW